MATETVTIPMDEYKELVRHKEVDEELISKLIRSLEDIRHGRIEEWVD